MGTFRQEKIAANPTPRRSARQRGPVSCRRFPAKSHLLTA